MDRGNRYEAAFEAYLRHYCYAYVAVNEQRRTVLGAAPIKNLDFIVCDPAGDTRLMIDVKGRRFPYGPPQRRRRVWECWTNAEDVTDLQRWADAFGSGALALLVFVYELADDVELAADVTDVWHWQGRRYLLRAVDVAAYRAAMRVRSPKWDTVDLPGARFRQLARPFRDFACPQPAAALANE
jgi:hypothetical protein